ncbi:MAG: hypothetical protein IID41_00970 [Planctomycetes bacterium]|nr:hypothetical protein [Planctomycetota bacterium]
MPGFTSIDRKNGKEAYPLSYDDNTVDEIYASHVLEHFRKREVGKVLNNWVSKLKSGGRIRIAVPDFEHICKRFLQTGSRDPMTISYAYGGQKDDDDFHKVGFDYFSLHDLMRACGLRQVRRWESDISDCAALPVSLNLEGVKPEKIKVPHITACMSTGKLGFTENLFCAIAVFGDRKIDLIKHTGAWWHQCLERIITPIVESREDGYICTMDYDTVFTGDIFDELCYLMGTHPEADAIAPWQVKRESDDILVWLENQKGEHQAEISFSDLEKEIVPVATAHFGLTLLRISALRKMTHPWFEEKTNPQGRWESKRIDADIGFWHNWKRAGNTLFISSHTSIGHLQQVATWPDHQLHPIHQYITDFQKHGPPLEARL